MLSSDRDGGQKLLTISNAQQLDTLLNKFQDIYPHFHKDDGK